MNRMETGIALHDKGYNCCQSVLGAFQDRLGLSEETAMRLGAGFGSGAGTGELCGAVTGGVMVLDLLGGGSATADIAGTKRRASQNARELQKRFSERFGALRCRDLLRAEKEEPSEAVASLGLTNHCSVMIASAIELVEEMLDGE